MPKFVHISRARCSGPAAEIASVNFGDGAVRKRFPRWPLTRSEKMHVEIVTVSEQLQIKAMNDPPELGNTVDREGALANVEQVCQRHESRNAVACAALNPNHRRDRRIEEPRLHRTK